MAARKVDLRGLVPRTPPEGLLGWTFSHCGCDLDRHGLVYEVEYSDQWDPCALLDPYETPKKRKMVRVTCSCCGTSTLLNWAKDSSRGYGFVHPSDEEGDWPRTVTTAGDKSVCPACGEPVLVIRRATIRDYYVPAETNVVSVGLVGDGLLALTVWTVQCRVYKSGCERYEVLPSEAYVFTPADCIALMGWRNSYSGKCGYFISWLQNWSQPRDWSERSVFANQIYGLTPDLIDQSCLPHCKLDVYMRKRLGTAHYPVAYLRLYQAHPNVEAVLLHGLPRVLDQLISARVEAQNWMENKRGRMEIPEIDWAETRPAQMLHLTREELRLAQAQHWERTYWTLFVGAKDQGERLTGEDIQNAHSLGDDHVTDLIQWGQVGKSLRYLLRQITAISLEVDDAGADPVPDVKLLTDYWDMCQQLGRSLADPAIRYPADLITAHDRAMELAKQAEQDGWVDQFRLRRRLLKRYAYVSSGLLIRPAASQRELLEEGDALHHCVATYAKRHATGRTAIFFIRRVRRPREPYYTLELDEQTLTVRQNRGLHNCSRTPQIRAFEAEWLDWVRAGALRDRDGQPVRPKGKRRRAS